jgi:hypothetical protein
MDDKRFDRDDIKIYERLSALEVSVKNIENLTFDIRREVRNPLKAMTITSAGGGGLASAVTLLIMRLIGS